MNELWGDSLSEEEKADGIRILEQYKNAFSQMQEFNSKLKAVGVTLIPKIVKTLTQSKKNDSSNAINADEINLVKNELELLRGEKLALKQSVKSDYTEDAVKILKGKGLENNEANMKTIIDKHPEWQPSSDDTNSGNVKPLGSTSGKTNPTSVSEAEQVMEFVTGIL